MICVGAGSLREDNEDVQLRHVELETNSTGFAFPKCSRIQSGLAGFVSVVLAVAEARAGFITLIKYHKERSIN